MSMKVSKMNMTNHSKEKIVPLENNDQFKRPDTATLERPSILDPSYLRKLDMSIISREKLMNIKNLLAKPHRNNDPKSNGSSYDSILSDTSINISDESIDKKFFIGSDDDTIKKNKKTSEKHSKTNKKKNQKSNKTKNSAKRNTENSEDNNKQGKDDCSDDINWEDEDYKANKTVINRTYRIKQSRRQSIIGNPPEAPKDETKITTTPTSGPSPRSSCAKLGSQTTLTTSPDLKKDKKCKKSDENVSKSQVKLVVKKNIALNKYSKKSLENLALKKSKSKERINLKPADKAKKVVSNGVKDKATKENIKDTSDVKEITKISKQIVTETSKKEKMEKVKYQTVPRQKNNSEPSPSKQKTSTSHRRSISEVTKIDTDSKENTTPKKTFLRKNSKDLNSPNVVRKFMDPITGKLRTVNEIPSAVKKIKESTLKVPSKGDERKGSKKSSSSTENSPRKSSDTISKTLSNCDENSRRSIDGFPTRKSSLSESYKVPRKASLNIDTTPRKADKTESGAERRRSCFGQSRETVFSTHLVACEKYEDLFRKSNIIPRDDPVISLASPIQSGIIQDVQDVTENIDSFNPNVEFNGNRVEESYEPSVNSRHMPPLEQILPSDSYFPKTPDLLSVGEFRSLIVTPTFYADESWTNPSSPQGSYTESLKKHKTIRCSYCLKHFGTASFTFHEPHCRQRWLRENSDLSSPLSQHRFQTEEEKILNVDDDTRGDLQCPRCNNKVPYPLVDIHEEHCRKIHASPSSPSHLSSSPAHISLSPSHRSSSPAHNPGSPSHLSPSPSHLSSSSSPNMSPSRKPRTVICYLCGREFGKSSIGIHEPQCLKKWHIENDKLPPSLRRPEPTRPEVIHISGTDKIDTEAMGEAAFKSYVAQLVPCGKCGRKFFPDRVVVHENVCKGLETRK